MNDSLRPLPPRAGEPSNVVSDAASTPDSSSDSFDSYNSDDAWHFLHVTKEEASAARVWLAESNAMVAGKMDSKNTYI